MGVVAPLLSLIPIGYNGYFSDGYWIRLIVNKKKLNLGKILIAIRYTVVSVIHLSFRKEIFIEENK
jgi:hypothetical protein